LKDAHQKIARPLGARISADIARSFIVWEVQKQDVAEQWGELHEIGRQAALDTASDSLWIKRRVEIKELGEDPAPGVIGRRFLDRVAGAGQREHAEGVGLPPNLLDEP
jgi:hypothetical protein